mgnify:CR=1 FL=1|jgi:hypothetical protein|tara:strand:+ start:68 stop:799 length:732 start_codon:yes stop_codon:yes gene_type:complete
MDKKVIGIIMLLLLCCISSSSGLAYSMMGDDEEKEDPVVPKTPAEVAAAKAQTALDALKADPDATADEIADAQAAADAADAAATPPPPPPPPPPLVCGTGYLKSGTECKKLLTSSGTWIEHGGPDPHVSAANMPGYKKDYHYEFGTYYEGGQVFNVKPIPGSVGPEREKHCFKKCDDAPTCDMVTFAKGTPRGLGNENVECWGRSGSAKRVFRTDDGRFTRGDNLMDSDYHNTYHKKSKTNMQ